MIKVRKAKDRGYASYDWLERKHTFSFGQYYDSEFKGFRVLRVINEDIVQPAKGFSAHPHKDMEIITYVIEGELVHKDSLGNGSVMTAGEFQCISAGSGIVHSEFNPSDKSETHFYQIWIKPKALGLEPKYQQKKISNGTPDLFALIASPNGDDGSMQINQDASLYLGNLSANQSFTLNLAEDRFGWLQVVTGNLELKNNLLVKGDGVSFVNEDNLSLEAKSATKFLFFDLP